MRAAATPAHRGFTLIEVAAVLAAMAILITSAVPVYQAQLRRAGRIDAVEALTRVQLAQAQYHALHGLYASELTLLRGVPQGLSTQGWYRIALQSQGAEGYRATAQALTGGRQAADTACQNLSVDVGPVQTHFGPSAQCWNR